MKTALIHYWLVNRRGGEKVLEQIAALFPAADIFTHVYDESAMPPAITRHAVHTSFIQRLPAARKLYPYYLPLMPRALKQLDLSGYDVIISSESGPAKGICKPKGAVHICYCHTPMRYLWDLSEYYYGQASPLKKAAMKIIFPELRKRDLKSADQVDHFLANSRFVAERILRIYGRTATVIYPPVDTGRFAETKRNPQDFYLLSGQLTAYKRADLAVRAFSRLDKKLVVAGSGEEFSRLKKSAGGHVKFLGRVSDDKLTELYSTCRALVFPGVEDFGMVPVEAQAAGAPVIAFRGGGALETVKENRTGLFFDVQSEDSLAEAVVRFEAMTFDAEACRANAQQFSVPRFKSEFAAFCAKVLPRAVTEDDGVNGLGEYV